MTTQRIINFTRGVPADESFPVEQITECAAAAVRGAHGNEVLQYGSSFGFAPLRRWLADCYGVGEEQVLLANGSLQLIDLIGWTLLEPGDRVLVESPTYDRVLTLLRRRSIEIVGIPVQPDGPDVGALEAAARQRRVRLLYTIPDFQNPSGICATMEKRQRITALAEEHGFWVIEDAPYRHLRYRGTELPSLFELSRKRILHMSSFTKQLSPGLRVGYRSGVPTSSHGSRR